MSQQLFNRQGEARQPNGKTESGQPIFRDKQNCSRCGGLGGSDKWGPKGTNTGWTCWRCGGSTWDPNPLIEKLYTAEQNAKLDAAQAKREATRAAARAEAARIEQERQDRERAEIISANEGFIARIDAELAHGEIEILQSVRDRITVQAKEPTDRQIEIVNQIIERNTAERKRRAGAQHVGTIKERREFTLTLLFTRSEQTGQFPTIWSHWSLFTDENGCKIACKSAPWTLGLKKVYAENGRDWDYEKGQTIRVKATVVEHTTDKRGEPLTYINRPKEV